MVATLSLTCIFSRPPFPTLLEQRHVVFPPAFCTHEGISDKNEDIWVRKTKFDASTNMEGLF